MGWYLWADPVARETELGIYRKTSTAECRLRVTGTKLFELNRGPRPLFPGRTIGKRTPHLESFLAVVKNESIPEGLFDNTEENACACSAVTTLNSGVGLSKCHPPKNSAAKVNAECEPACL